MCQGAQGHLLTWTRGPERQGGGGLGTGTCHAETLTSNGTGVLRGSEPLQGQRPGTWGLCEEARPRGAYFFRGACLPLRDFFRACLAMATLVESQDEAGVFGGSAASGFWFGKWTRGPFLASLSFCSSDFTALRMAFAAFLLSAAEGRSERGARSPACLWSGDRQQRGKAG